MMTAALRCTAALPPGDLDATSMPARTAITADRVREAVGIKMKQAPILTFPTSDADFCSDKEPREPCQKRWPLKLGKVQTADSVVVKLVYSTGRQPPAYENLSVPPFVRGYLAILSMPLS